MSNIQEVAQKLNTWEKYTLFRFDDFGFPYHIHITLLTVEVKPFAQHKEALWLTYRSKGKRNDRVQVVLPGQSLVIWKGWQVVNSDMYVKTDDAGHKISRLCFSKEYIEDALKSVSLQPIINI